MPSERGLCSATSVRLAGEADGTATLTGPQRRHLEGCLRCQAERLRYRRLLRVTAGLATAPLEVDPAVEREVLAALDREDARLRNRVPARTAATIGGIAAGAAAAAGAIVVVASRRRVGLAV